MPRLNVLRVIFMLSTIVFATDCCSSRILLYKDQTLQTVYDQRPQNTPSPAQQQKQQLTFEKSTQNAPKQLQVDFDLNNSHTLIVDQHTATPITTQSSDFTVTYETTATTDGGTLPSTTDAYLEENLLMTQSRNASCAVEMLKKTREAFIGFFNDLYFLFVSYFLRLDCGEPFRTEFCLNRGRCFRVSFNNYSIFCCECAHGFVGERCDGKYIDGQYKPVIPERRGEQPKIRSARFSLNFPMLLTLSALYLICGVLIVFKCPPHKQRSYDLEQS